MTKDGAVFAKGKIKGDVSYPPFERFDEDTLLEIQKFQVYPLGKITEYCRHIPYNSEKKSFLEKTGRESFEGMSSLSLLYSYFLDLRGRTLADLIAVFQYIFKVPGDDKDYTVM